MKNNGKFVISLDFELYWGVRDVLTMEEYGEQIKGVHTAIPKLLDAFKKYEINSTISIVGLLFLEDKEAILAHIPQNLPSYTDTKFTPYSGYLNEVGQNYKDDVYHYGKHLLDEIKKHPNQEIGTHTYSHYYCLEKGQTLEQFRADIEMAIEVAKNNNVQLSSLVFPRNQFNNDYLKVCSDLGIICYRGNERSWLYEAKNNNEESKLRRALRLVDTYINISGHNCYSEKYLKNRFPVDIPSSRFLRSYSKKLKMFEKLRLKRILSGMTYAAKHNLTFHLWSHPHNFGINQDENFSFLDKILQHYSKLNNKYNFQSVTMTKLAEEILKTK